LDIAFVKFAGLSAGGTERWLQMMAVKVAERGHNVTYFYCDAAPYQGGKGAHAPNDAARVELMSKSGVQLVKFHVGAKNLRSPTHEWLDTDFWELFDERRFDLVQTAKAGPREYPYHLLKGPVVEFVALNEGHDRSKSIAWSVHLSQWQRARWISRGGDLKKSSVIPIPAFIPSSSANFRSELRIKPSELVLGLHQRSDNGIFSEIPLQAFNKLSSEFPIHFVLMGGGDAYRKQASELGLRNVHFVPHSGEDTRVSRFLNTLDIYTHGRKDGETFGTVLAEAMAHRKPVISHKSILGSNAQPETMGPGGFFADDLNSYTNQLFSILSSSDLRNDLALAGLEHAQKYYDLDQCADLLLDTYSRILADTDKSSNPPSGVKSQEILSYGATPLGTLMAGDLSNELSDASSVLTGKVHIHGTFLLLREILENAGEYSIFQFSSQDSLIAPWLSSMGNLQKTYFVTTDIQVARSVKESANLGRWTKKLELFTSVRKSDDASGKFEVQKFSSLTDTFESQESAIGPLSRMIPRSAWDQIQLVSLERNVHLASIVKELSALIFSERPLLLMRSVPGMKGMRNSEIASLSEVCATHYHWFRVTRGNRLLSLRSLESMTHQQGDLLGISSGQMESIDFMLLDTILKKARKDLRQHGIRDLRYRVRKKIGRISLPMRRRLGIN